MYALATLFLFPLTTALVAYSMHLLELETSISSPIVWHLSWIGFTGWVACAFGTSLMSRIDKNHGAYAISIVAGIPLILFELLPGDLLIFLIPHLLVLFALYYYYGQGILWLKERREAAKSHQAHQSL